MLDEAKYLECLEYFKSLFLHLCRSQVAGPEENSLYQYFGIGNRTCNNISSVNRSQGAQKGVIQPFSCEKRAVNVFLHI